MVKKWERPDNPYHAVGDPKYPHVMTTYRLTEHHSGGIPTRMVPTTAELQPEGFAEISPERPQTMMLPETFFAPAGLCAIEIPLLRQSMRKGLTRRATSGPGAGLGLINQCGT